MAAAKPPVIPELFTGNKSWEEWIDHFESVAEVCGWDNANKLKWMTRTQTRVKVMLLRNFMPRGLHLAIEQVSQSDILRTLHLRRLQLMMGRIYDLRVVNLLSQ